MSVSACLLCEASSGSLLHRRIADFLMLSSALIQLISLTHKLYSATELRKQEHGLSKNREAQVYNSLFSTFCEFSLDFLLPRNSFAQDNVCTEDTRSCIRLLVSDKIKLFTSGWLKLSFVD